MAGVAYVEFFGDVLVDMRDATVDASKMLKGTIAYGDDGGRIVGELELATVYTGSGAPTAGIGSDGDIYLDLG